MLSKKVGWVNSSGIGWYWCDTKLEAALNESKGVMAMPRMRSWDVSEANERNIKKRHHIFTVDDVPSYLIILRSALQFPHAVWLISIFGQIKVFLRHSKCKFLTDTTDTCFRGTKRRVLHGRILSNEFMLAISTIVWSGVILLVWNTHVHYFMIYTERERERWHQHKHTSDSSRSSRYCKFRAISSKPGWRHNSRARPQSHLRDAEPGKLRARFDMFDMPMYAVVEISAQTVINAMLYYTGYTWLYCLIFVFGC